MLEVLEIAREKGLQEGLQEGKALGGIEATREIVVDMLIDRFGLVPAHISTKIRSCDNLDVFKGPRPSGADLSEPGRL